LEIPLHKKLAAEFVGTFCLTFAGTGAIVVDAQTGMVTHVGIALTFGLVVFAMIAAVGDISGAHLNPAVTIGFFAARRFPARCVSPYLAAQFAGALVASALLFAMFPGSVSLGATNPSGSPAQAWVMEICLAAILMFVILGVSTGAKEKGVDAGLAIGGVVALEALFGGPVSGASMNPARSFAPAVVGGDLRNLWVYLTAPVAGVLVAVLACCAARERGCCSRANPECV
jgi:aquaporin Z